MFTFAKIVFFPLSSNYLVDNLRKCNYFSLIEVLPSRWMRVSTT